MPRPVGVVLIAILYFFAAAFVVLVGVGLIIGVSLIPALSPDPRITAVLAGLGGIRGVFLIVPAAILTLIGWGLLAMKNWARVLTIVLGALGVVGVLLALVLLPSRPTAFSVVALIRAAINLVIIWYLLRADVKRAFAAAQGVPAA